jgi:maleylacetoacetate isomerase
MAKVVLYTYWRSSSSYRVRFALAHKKIAYESIPVNILVGEQLKDEHVKRSPTGYVPCLEVDGRPVMESVAIIELLEELFPDPPLYPRDAWGRARVRALVEVVNSGTQPLQNLAVLKHLSDDKNAQKEWAAHFNARGLASIERLMEMHEKEGVEGRFAYGDTLTAADVFLVPQVYSAQRFGVDLSPYPRAVAAAEAALATDAAQSAIPERQADARP